MTMDQVLAYATQQAELLKHALHEGDRKAAFDAFSPHRELDADENAAARSVLVAELIAFIGHIDEEDALIELAPESRPLVMTYEREGRSGEYFKSVFEQLKVLSEDTIWKVVAVSVLLLTPDPDEAGDVSDPFEPRVGGGGQPDRGHQRQVSLEGGVTIRWSEASGCWSGDDGKEYVLLEGGSPTWLERVVYEAAFPGQPLPRYDDRWRDRREEPNRPVNHRARLHQPMSAEDWRELDQLTRLFEKGGQIGGAGAARAREKARAFQLKHYRRTGRWLTGEPPTGVEGWYRDTAGDYAQRYWDGSQWTRHVKQSDGATVQDLKWTE